MKKILITALIILAFIGFKIPFKTTESIQSSDIVLNSNSSSPVPTSFDKTNYGEKQEDAPKDAASVVIGTSKERSTENLKRHVIEIQLPGSEGEAESIFYDNSTEELIVKDAETGQVLYRTPLSQELLATNFSADFKTTADILSESYDAVDELAINLENTNTFTLLPNEDEPEVLVLQDGNTEEIIHIDN